MRTPDSHTIVWSATNKEKDNSNRRPEEELQAREETEEGEKRERLGFRNGKSGKVSRKAVLHKVDHRPTLTENGRQGRSSGGKREDLSGGKGKVVLEKESRLLEREENVAEAVVGSWNAAEPGARGGCLSAGHFRWCRNAYARGEEENLCCGGGEDGGKAASCERQIAGRKFATGSKERGSGQGGNWLASRKKAYSSVDNARERGEGRGDQGLCFLIKPSTLCGGEGAKDA